MLLCSVSTLASPHRSLNLTVKTVAGYAGTNLIALKNKFLINLETSKYLGFLLWEKNNQQICHLLGKYQDDFFLKADGRYQEAVFVLNHIIYIVNNKLVSETKGKQTVKNCKWDYRRAFGWPVLFGFNEVSLPYHYGKKTKHTPR